MTNGTCRTRIVHEKTKVTQASCPRKHRGPRDDSEAVDMPIEPREANAPQLPVGLRKFGIDKVAAACRCLQTRPVKTITRHVPTTVVCCFLPCCGEGVCRHPSNIRSNLWQVVPVTRVKTVCVVATCKARNVPCDIGNPGECCSKTCIAASGCA